MSQGFQFPVLYLYIFYWVVLSTAHNNWLVKARFDMMSNYRPISVIGHIAKIVEQLIRSQLVAYLDEHSFITPDQFAYLKGHSTQKSLHRVIDDWLENVNESQITGICMLDIAKCFDTIDRDLLLKKLSLYGIKNIELEWFKSYLHQCQQAVLCNGKLSSFVDISSGVPQGSVLGPFLSTIFLILLQMAAW